MQLVVLFKHTATVVCSHPFLSLEKNILSSDMTFFILFLYICTPSISAQASRTLSAAAYLLF